MCVHLTAQLSPPFGQDLCSPHAYLPRIEAPLMLMLLTVPFTGKETERNTANVQKTTAGKINCQQLLYLEST